jgi:hypothetical protein
MKQETIMKRMEAYSEESKHHYTNGGKLSGGVYTADEDHWDFVGEVMKKTVTSNPLHFGEFQYIC